jgi:hypothetical protein
VEQLDNCTRKCSFKCKRTGSPDPFHPWLQITATIDKIESWSWNDMLQEHTVATTASSLHLSPSGINVTERRSRIAFASRQKQLLRVPAKKQRRRKLPAPKAIRTGHCRLYRYAIWLHNAYEHFEQRSSMRSNITTDRGRICCHILSGRRTIALQFTNI